MNNQAKNVTLTICALVVYLGFMIGIGFIWNLFWQMDERTTILYWVVKGIVLFMVVVFSLFMVFGKSDKGMGAMQVVFSLFVSLLPIVLRALCLIPVAGFYIALILALIVMALYLFAMIGFGSYSKGEGNQKI